MTKKIFWILLSAMLLTLLCACGGENTDTPMPSDAKTWRAYFLRKADEVTVTDGAVSFPDGMGEMRTVPVSPKKTAILYASFTTLWYEAGGTVSGCLGGEAVTELYLEQIGRDISADAGVEILADSAQAKRWDVERILAAQPDLLICSSAMSGYATVEAPARAAGIPVVPVDYADFADYLKWFKVFCHLSGHPERWESVAMATLDEVIEILTACPQESSLRVLGLFTGVDSLKANTSSTMLGGMLQAMGAENVADGWTMVAADHAIVNTEAILQADPDIILIQCHSGTDTAKELVERLYGEDPLWHSLRAVREGRVYYLEKSLFHNKPNRRFAEAYAVLAECLFAARTS